ncbi:hypothetical protein [Sphingomonas sp. Leaf25]|uniref:hypothetical protein n=1 Tax=Sphingomonas sp. Leaf25 TaxID=1735692 RepID=UPI0006FE1664|nr:hypothetical protein [Sphingomonas sp. Leaf25]KQM98278.1 hypothetical protein ASE78_08540 [Sphingomonas sp. Leaf25]
MATTHAPRQPGLPLAPTVAGVAGLAVVALVALVPAWRIEAAVMASGLPALLPAAAPPLGWTARAGLMLGFGGLVTVLLWLGLMLLAPTAVLPLPRRKPKAKPRRAEVPPSVRRADAHPDAPPRPPVRADRDLGAPFLDTPLVPATPDGERTIPRDLDMPLAMFDPDALPAAPAAPTPTVKPLFRPDAVTLPEDRQTDPIPLPDKGGAGDESAAEETPPPALDQPTPDPSLVGEGSDSRPEAAASKPDLQSLPKPTGEPSLSALLARLDEGLSRRDPLPEPPVQTEPPAPIAPQAVPTPIATSEPPPPEPPATPEPPAPRVPAGLAATLGQLRRMATGEKE